MGAAADQWCHGCEAIKMCTRALLGREWDKNVYTQPCDCCERGFPCVQSCDGCVPREEILKLIRTIDGNLNTTTAALEITLDTNLRLPSLQATGFCLSYRYPSYSRSYRWTVLVVASVSVLVIPRGPWQYRVRTG